MKTMSNRTHHLRCEANIITKRAKRRTADMPLERRTVGLSYVEPANRVEEQCRRGGRSCCMASRCKFDLTGAKKFFNWRRDCEFSVTFELKLVEGPTNT